MESSQEAMAGILGWRCCLHKNSSNASEEKWKFRMYFKEEEIGLADGLNVV